MSLPTKPPPLNDDFLRALVPKGAVAMPRYPGKPGETVDYQDLSINPEAIRPIQVRIPPTMLAATEFAIPSGTDTEGR